MLDLSTIPPPGSYVCLTIGTITHPNVPSELGCDLKTVLDRIFKRITRRDVGSRVYSPAQFSGNPFHAETDPPQ